MDSDQENKVNINTTRLTLRPVINSDELLLIQLLMDKKVRKHLGGHDKQHQRHQVQGKHPTQQGIGQQPEQ